MLELSHIQKSFDGVSVLKDISIQVEDGEIVSILGPSGCGKTTLLNIILGIVEADAGTIVYNGEDLTRTVMEKRGFNIVFQDYALFPNLNVYQNITYGLKNKPGISSEEEVEELIHLLGLEDHLNKRVDQLSGGQKQRVALARTMVMKPRILLLDEPLSALDGVIKESIKDRIKTIAREYHLTTIIVTHDPEEALTLSDRVLIIDQGTIAQYGRPAEIIQKPENDFVRKFILNQLEIKRNNIYALFGSSANSIAGKPEDTDMKRKSWELKLIFLVLVAVFAVFLAVPAIRLLLKSFLGEDGLTGAYYLDVFSGKGFTTALGNSFAVSIVSALVAVGIAFVMAYIIHYTRLPRGFKRFVQAVATLPMFLPTITYGFAIIYSFGKQGLITRLLGHQFFDIYGFGGLLVGYVIYTVPVAFLLIHHTMGYVDKKTLVVSKAMGDGTLSTFWIAILRPLLGTLAGAFIQAFFLCFTDFGIPASVGGDYEVIATVLYNEMLGGVPDFNRGAVISVVAVPP